MVSATTLFAGAAALYAVFVYVNGLRKNIADARKAALPYIVVRKSATGHQAEGHSAGA